MAATDMESSARPDLTDRFLPIEHSGDFDASLMRLIENYVSVVESSRTVPFISLRDWLVFYAKFFWWEIQLFVVPIVLVVNAIAWTFARCTRRSYARLGWRSVEVLLAPFLAIHQGEIAVVKFLTLRGVVRLVVYFRVRGCLSAIVLRLQQAEIRGFVLRNVRAFDSQWYEQRIALIKDVKDAFGQKLGYAFWGSLASATSLFAVIKGAYELFPQEWKSGLLKVLTDLTPVSFFPPQGHRESMFGALSFALVLFDYVVWIIVTNFIVARALLKEAATYTVEAHDLSSMGIRIPRELPVDIIGLTVMMAFTFALFASESRIREVDILMMTCILFFLLYAWVRRRQVNR